MKGKAQQNVCVHLLVIIVRGLCVHVIVGMNVNDVSLCVRKCPHAFHGLLMRGFIQTLFHQGRQNSSHPQIVLKKLAGVFNPPQIAVEYVKGVRIPMHYYACLRIYVPANVGMCAYMYMSTCIDIHVCFWLQKILSPTFTTTLHRESHPIMAKSHPTHPVDAQKRAASQIGVTAVLSI